jgi:hypothetical protein
VITAILAGLDITAAFGAVAACRRALHLLRTIPGCCPVCDGAGGDYNGPCWDCQATGHPHLGLCMWGSPRVQYSPAEEFQPWQAHLRARASALKVWWMEL